MSATSIVLVNNLKIVFFTVIVNGLKNAHCNICTQIAQFRKFILICEDCFQLRFIVSSYDLVEDMRLVPECIFVPFVNSKCSDILSCGNKKICDN